MTVRFTLLLHVWIALAAGVSFPHESAASPWRDPFPNHTGGPMGRVDSVSDPVGAICLGYLADGTLDTVAQGGVLVDRDHDGLGRLTRFSRDCPARMSAMRAATARRSR